MEEQQSEQLYHLLPSIYRLRDKSQGEPLRALMAALESEMRVVEEDIDALYDNWFIETCDEWTLPYLASHVGAFSLDGTAKLFPSQRRQVANTLGYRRRKGLSAILEHVLADVTGWQIHCVEYAQLVASTQHLATVSGTRGQLANLRQPSELALLNGPFESTAHTIDVRNIGRENGVEMPDRTRQGKYLPGNLGVFVWRLRSYALKVVPARTVSRRGEHALAPGCFTFDPLGRDLPLFNLPQTADALTQPLAPVNLARPLSRLDLEQDLADYHAQQPDAQSPENPFEEEDLLHNSLYYGPDRALCVLLNGAPLLPGAIISADLSQWRLPPVSSRRTGSRVAIDVALGRLRFLDASTLQKSDTVEVNYCYGFSADLGGGPYTRSSPATEDTRYRINVLRGGKVSTLQQALAAWDEYCRAWEKQHQGADSLQMDRPRGTIHIVDNGLYVGELVINLPKNGDLMIEATNGVRPVIEGNVRVESPHGSPHLRLNGLLINGKFVVEGGLNLEIGHCTLMPHGLETHASSRPTQLAIDHSIVGPLQLRNRRGTLTIRDSIIDHAAGSAIVALPPEDMHGGPTVSLERTTIFGQVQVNELCLALNVLFTEPVLIRNRQHGLVSFSYIPAHSRTPRREHCLPSSADEQSQSEQIKPLFTSRRYGEAAYAQLTVDCSSQIRRGADNGSEMGAFNSLRQAQRQDNIAQALDEYLPFGLAAGVFYLT